MFSPRHLNQRLPTGQRRSLAPRPCVLCSPRRQCSQWPPEGVRFTCRPTGICHRTDHGVGSRWKRSGPHPERGRLCARRRERIQSSVSHLSSLFSYYATILSLFDRPTLGTIRLGLCHFHKMGGFNMKPTSLKQYSRGN